MRAIKRKSYRGTAKVEHLSVRELLCAPGLEATLVGTAVPWLTAPVTQAALPANEPGIPLSTLSQNQRPLAEPTPRAITSSTVRINAGGSAYADSLGQAWSADKNFVGGTPSSSSYDVANTTNDPIYQTRRYGAFNYNIPVGAPGTYTLKLHFADPVYTVPGKRKFSVKAEGNTLLSFFDLAASGGGKSALVRTFNVAINDGTLNLAFLKGMENPIVSGIEIIPPSSGTVTVGSVSGLTLIDANSDTAIGLFTGGSTLDVSGGKAYSVRAELSGTVKSVKFLLDGSPIHIESSLPFSVAGDTSGNYAPWSLAAGNHTLSVIPYTGTGATGSAGTAYSVNFNVTGSPAPTPGGFTQIDWVTKASSPIARAEALTATSGTRIYVFGGFSLSNGPVARSYYYDTAANTWTRIADLPQRLTHVGMAQDVQNAYLVGGYVGTGAGYTQTFGTTKAYRYNFAANTYTALPDLPRALAGGGAALVGNELHYFGGYNLDRSDTNIHLVLDLDELESGWENAAPLPHARSHMGSLAFGGKIYSIAGQTGNDEGLTTRNYVEIFDPATDAWTVGAPLPASISHIASATFVMGNRIIVMGGETAHNVPTRNAYAYTPATNSWSVLTPLPAPKFSGVASTVNGKIYFTTGGSSVVTWEGTPS